MRPKMKRAGCGWRPRSGRAPTRSERAAALVEAGVDALVLDTAHGHSSGSSKCSPG